MTIRATREISRPDRHNFFNAYSEQSQAQTVVDILQGVSLVIGSVFLAAPASARIYEAFRFNTDRAAALRIYTGFMRGATIEDLEDFIYLLDDTLAGPGVPGMAPGQEWTITYQTVGGAAHQSLLSRLRDRQASYGNFAHYQAIDGNGTGTAEGAIRVVYNLTSTVSSQARADQLAHLLHSFFMSDLAASRDAAQNIDDYRNVFNNGYVSFTNVQRRRRESDLFLALMSELSDSERSGAAHAAIVRLNTRISADRRSAAESGAMQFMESVEVMMTLYNNIRGQGVGANTLTAHRVTGFQAFDTTEKNLARDGAEVWRRQARQVVSGAAISHPVRVHLNNNIDTSLEIYRTALFNPAQLPANMSSLYYSHLHTSPFDIWGAYTTILAPISRRTGDRLAHIILASWDPRSGEPPPDWISAVGGTLRTLFGLQ